MEVNTKNIEEEVKAIFNTRKFEDAINLLTDEVLEREKNAALYVWRGNACYNINEYNNAIADYEKAIEINSNYALAFYNRGFARVAKKDYSKAIEDYSKAISIDSEYASAYVMKVSILRTIKKYNNAIADYNKAIEADPYYANAYYNRGLAKKENNVDLEGSKQDFEKYLELTAEENDIWTKYAKYYIKDLNTMIKDPELKSIRQIVDNIKAKLLIKEECITHYTSLSVLQHLILENSKFRISEGNFMNDLSEGKEFLNFLQDDPYVSYKSGSLSESFSPKPFIGSFVSKDKYDDLNMWRFYGKEKGEEAKGGAITLRTQEFIEIINYSLPKGEEDFLKYESDINFYWVVYVEQNGITRFHVANSDKSEDLENLMNELKEKVNYYKENNIDQVSLNKYLNSIAFLFKSNVYKNENEVRLVVDGIEFEKKYVEDMFPPRVYIELESIKKIVEQIILGPKVVKANEWASALYYSYEANAPEIIISHLPYK